ncbi:MAG: aminotransferase class V-fold PLP-dependent enzyme, partial [Clostridia bacterium]|nr:aminotransferase class V-fold PLP-dependent enzyme [Clostridia bacterium]
MIYLDNAATTRPNSGAVSRANEFITENYYNPSARYRGGDEAARALKAARRAMLAPVAGDEFDLIFTSGGTEADNHAVFSSARRGNAVTTAGEHAAVYESFVQLKSRGVEPRFAPLNQDGSVNEDALLELVDEKTSFVSVVHVNNETGAVNDIFSLARRVKEKNPRVVFHSDGVQAYGKIPVRLTDDIDLYSISAHKIGALKGTGALIKRKKCSLLPLIYGGGQEGALRSGTENTFGIACFRFAAEE